MKAISDMVTSWLTVIIILIGGVIAYNQYIRTVELDRVSKTVSLFVQYNSEAMVKSRRAVFDPLNTNNDKIIAIVRQRDKGTSLQEIDVELDNFYIGLLVGQPVENDFVVLFAFLEGWPHA